MLNYFDQTGKEVLDRIKSHRGTAIRPQQTASADYMPSRARALPDALELPAGTTLMWIAHDFEGNQFDDDSVEPSLGPLRRVRSGPRTTKAARLSGLQRVELAGLEPATS